MDNQYHWITVGFSVFKSPIQLLNYASWQHFTKPRANSHYVQLIGGSWSLALEY